MRRFPRKLRLALAAAGLALFLPRAGHGRDSGVSTASEPPWAWSLGTRIGGYGFRHASGDHLTWDDCRMNGVGGFAQLNRHDMLYVQFSLDGYHATGTTVAAGMERLSLLAGVAIGAQFENRTPFWPHIEIGLGGELTGVDIDGISATRVLPTAHIGIGGEIAIQRVRLGITLRVLGMGLPGHEHSAGSDQAKHAFDATAPEAAPPDEVTFDVAFAGQLTFSMRYAF